MKKKYFFSHVWESEESLMAFSYKWEIFNLIFACKSSRAMMLAACFYHVVLMPSPHIIPIFTLVCIEIIT